jgi:osmotically-inducible protein OsmY
MRRLLYIFMAFMMVLLVGAGCSKKAKSDDTVARDVESRLNTDPQLSSAQIKVKVEDGTVKLDGKVNSEQEAEKALTLARGVPGVQRVQSSLTIDQKITNSDINNRVEQGEKTAQNELEQRTDAAGNVIDDASITAKVKLALAKDPQVSALHIDVDTNAQVVTLTGDVKSDNEAAKAIQIAQAIEGVKKVTSVLTVKK